MNIFDIFFYVDICIKGVKYLLIEDNDLEMVNLRFVEVYMVIFFC